MGTTITGTIILITLLAYVLIPNDKKKGQIFKLKYRIAQSLLHMKHGGTVSKIEDGQKIVRGKRTGEIVPVLKPPEILKRQPMSPGQVFIFGILFGCFLVFYTQTNGAVS